MRSRQAEDRGPTPGRYDDGPPKWLAPGVPSEHLPASCCCMPPHQVRNLRAPCVCVRCPVCVRNRESSYVIEHVSLADHPLLLPKLLVPRLPASS